MKKEIGCMKKEIWPYLRVSLQVVQHQSQAEGGSPLVGPPTLTVAYANDGNLPSYSAYLITYWWKLDPATSAWDYCIHRKEILTLQPGASSSLEYPLPTFASLPKHPAAKHGRVTFPAPTPSPPPVKFRMVSMIFDPVLDPLPKPPEQWFASPSTDRHGAYTGELTPWWS